MLAGGNSTPPPGESYLWGCGSFMNNFIEMQSQDRARNLRRIFALLLLLASAFVLLPAVSRADTTAAYKINGTLESGGTYSGVLEFDYNPVTNMTTLINSHFTVDGTSFFCSGLTGGNQCVAIDSFGTDFFQAQSGSSFALLQWAAIDFSGPPPASFTFANGYFTSWANGKFDVFNAGGSADFVPAPEPSSLMLLGAGLLGLAFLVRRRANSVRAA
jgi:hypothetical protein